MSEEESSTITEESSESSSDSDEETIHDIPDKEFFKTLSCLKTKDPRIYDNKVQFFTEPTLVIKKSQNSVTSEKQIINKEEIAEFSKQSNISTKNKFSLKDIDNDSSSEDEMSAFKKGTDEKLQVQNEVENDYIQFLKGRKSNIGDKEVETTLKPLHDYWNTQELDENEKFLKDYILNKKYLASGADEKLGEENLSDDERELEEQAEYEANYNFRFENEENLKIKRFPRAIEGSLRKKNDTRKKKRAEIAQRKKEEKAKKHQDIKKKQKEKFSEIEGRLQKLKDLTGNVELGFKDDEILGDFDPEKHDQKMNELFNDDYYNKGDEEHHPVFDDDDETYWDDNENINMDCDADISEVHKNKLTRAQKKKLLKKKTYQDVLDLAKPSFDPKVHNDFKKYIDEYYSMDCEDFIDDLPCKFKYREVVANDFGLSIEEILMADDTELNRWASLKKITRRCPNHVEKNEVSIYRAKSNDEYLKKKMLPSLYIDPEESNEQNEINSQSNALNNKKQVNDINSSKNKDPNNIEDEELQDQSMIDEDLKNTVSDKSEQKKKKKKKKHKKDNTAKIIKNEVNEIGNELNTINTEKDTSLKKEIPQVMGDGTNTNTITQKKKNRKKKKKKKQNTLSNSNNSSTNNQNQETGMKKPENNNQNKGQAKKKGKFSNQQRDSSQNNSGKIENKLKKKFKKKKEGVVNLSDSRLQAYGIKPKQFRSKIIYSQKSKT